MSLTGIVKNVFNARLKELERYKNNGAEMQQEVLEYLVGEARDTEFGRKHLFSAINGYERFAEHVPVGDYESLKADIDRIKKKLGPEWLRELEREWKEGE